jgi:hypothetical protein
MLLPLPLLMTQSLQRIDPRLHRLRQPIAQIRRLLVSEMSPAYYTLHPITLRELAFNRKA